MDLESCLLAEYRVFCVTEEPFTITYTSVTLYSSSSSMTRYITNINQSKIQLIPTQGIRPPEGNSTTRTYGQRCPPLGCCSSLNLSTATVAKDTIPPGRKQQTARLLQQRRAGRGAGYQAKCVLRESFLEAFSTRFFQQRDPSRPIGT